MVIINASLYSQEICVTDFQQRSKYVSLEECNYEIKIFSDIYSGDEYLKIYKRQKEEIDKYLISV